MENRLSTKDRGNFRKNWVPTPPDEKGNWIDKGRDHNSFQSNVSLAARLGGVHANAGCPTESAKRARRDAEQQYYRSREIHPKQISKRNKI